LNESRGKKKLSETVEETLYSMNIMKKYSKVTFMFDFFRLSLQL